MTKQEFITALREALAPMEEQERAAHCDYYAEMIDDMLEAGLTEAEVFERLGDPAALAREMRGEVGGEPKHISLRESLAQIMRSFASVRFGPGESWSRAEEHSFSGNIRSLDVQWRSGETEIAVSDRDGVELIEYRSENAPAMVSWQQEDTLFVRFAPEGERCREAKRLRVLLPRAAAGALLDCRVSTASADVKLAGLRAETVTADTKSGDICLEDVAAGTGELGALSGDMTGWGDFKHLRAHTASGDIELRTERTAEADVRAASGDISLEGRIDVLTVHSASGNVDYTGLSDRIEAVTASGDGELSLRGLPASLRWSSASGDLELRLPAGSECSLRFESVSGDLDCRGVRTFAAEEPTLLLRTTSGDVTILA